MSLSIVPTASGPTDEHDHQILLVDGSSRPSSPPDASTQGDPNRLAQTFPIDSGLRNSGTHLSRKWTLREELARRKYAKWQEQRLNGGGEASADGVGRRETNSDAGGSETPGRRSAQDSLIAQHPKQYAGKEQSEIEILYENQRGSYACGVPLYSRRGLLHFDPAPWTNASYKDSLVDITNAQPPDPTWQWAWRSWYVDMSGDVDEEGWQYSFAFSPRFSWHGTHQWFHSFVRRRRWLRKRVKPRRTAPDAAIPGMERFSVHSAQNRSRDHSRTRDSQVLNGNRQSYFGREPDGRGEHDLQHVRDIGALMIMLRSGRIDREKLEAVSSFLEHGQEDMAHLAEFMPEILSLFIFQASRRQLLAKLLDTFSDASDDLKARLEHDEKHGAAERQRVDSLQEALGIADEQVKKLEYWSDVKEMTHEGEPHGAADPEQGWGSEWQGVDPSGPETDLRDGKEGSDRGDAGEPSQRVARQEDTDQQDQRDAHQEDTDSGKAKPEVSDQENAGQKDTDFKDVHEKGAIQDGDNDEGASQRGVAQGDANTEDDNIEPANQEDPSPKKARQEDVTRDDATQDDASQRDAHQEDPPSRDSTKEQPHSNIEPDQH